MPCKTDHEQVKSQLIVVIDRDTPILALASDLIKYRIHCRLIDISFHHSCVRVLSLSPLQSRQGHLAQPCRRWLAEGDFPWEGQGAWQGQGEGRPFQRAPEDRGGAGCRAGRIQRRG